MSRSNLITAHSALLTPNELDDLKLTRIMSRLLDRGADYADIYFQAKRSESWSLDEGIVKTGGFAIKQGVGVRAIAGERTALAFSGDLSLAALTQAADATRSIASAVGGLRTVSVDDHSGSLPNRQLYLPQDPFHSLHAREKVGLLERIDKMARAKDPRVRQVMAGISGSYEVVLIARSDGHQVADVRPMVRVNVSVVVEQQGRRELATAGGGGRFDYAYFTDAKLAEYVDLAVARALVNLDARPAPAGTMPVVLGAGWPGILLHEAIGHGLEGDHNRKGSSAFAGRIGERVAAKGVTIVDDGTLPNARGSLNVDDEGNATQCTTLIEDGVLKGYLQDKLNAKLMKMPVTGNGRRESYAAQPIPRMTNTYMLNGNKDPVEIISSVKRGLYAVNFSGGEVDIASGKFVFSATEAYMIEDGKLAYPVKGATLIGNGPDALNYVSMIGNDLALDPGIAVCGKQGQSVPVGVGQPTLLLERLTVGGTAKS